MTIKELIEKLEEVMENAEKGENAKVYLVGDWDFETVSTVYESSDENIIIM